MVVNRRRAPRALPFWPFFLVLGLAAAARPAVKVVVDGNRYFPDRKLASLLEPPKSADALGPKEWQDWLDDAAAAVTDLYAGAGFFDARARARLLADSAPGPKAKAEVRIDVDEGQRYRFGEVKVACSDGAAPLVDPGSLQAARKKSYRDDYPGADVRAIERAYGDHGFVHAKVSEATRVDSAAKEVDVEYRVDPGYALVFDTLIIRDQREGSGGMRGITRQRLLRELLDLRRGDTVRLSVTDKYRRKLNATRAFNYVRFRDSLMDDRGHRSALVLSLEERVPGDLDAGLFYETQYGPGVSANLGFLNILGQFHDAKLGLSVAERRQNLYGAFGSPLFFHTSFRFDNDLNLYWYQDHDPQRGRPPFAGNFDLSYNSKLSRALALWARFESGAELRGESYRRYADSAGTRVDTLRDLNLNYINSLFATFLDEPVNPTRGSRYALHWGNGGPFIQGGTFQLTEYRHNWLELESAYYWPIIEEIDLALRLNGGRFFGVGGLNSRNFFLGGSRSVRGFGFRDLCPRRDSAGYCSDDVAPAYVLASAEVRLSPFNPQYIRSDSPFRHFIGVQFVPFADFGQVWEWDKPLVRNEGQPLGRGWAYGMGLRYNLLAVFNLRVDYALGFGGGRKGSNSEIWVDLAQAF